MTFYKTWPEIDAKKGPWNILSVVEQEPVRMPNESLPSLQCPKAEESESVENSYPKKHFSLVEKK